MTLQQRHFDYVLGPNQDARLASVAPGQVITEILLQLDPDAPFLLRGRALRCKGVNADGGVGILQTPLRGVSSKWTGPVGDFRQQDYVPEALQMANFGQLGNPKPVSPQIQYPAGSVLRIDLQNTGASTITNLTFYWRGVKLYPPGAVPAYTYPKQMAALSYAWDWQITALPPAAPPRLNIPIQLQTTDGDYVIRGGLATPPFQSAGPRTLAEVFIVLKDHQNKPFSNDYMPLDILFGAGSWPSTFPIGLTPSLIAPFGPGPALPGLFYPEIYVPRLTQLFYDVSRTDGIVGTNQNEDIIISFVGSKVFAK